MEHHGPLRAKPGRASGKHTLPLFLQFVQPAFDHQQLAAIGGQQIDLAIEPVVPSRLRPLLHRPFFSGENLPHLLNHRQCPFDRSSHLAATFACRDNPSLHKTPTSNPSIPRRQRSKKGTVEAAATRTVAVMLSSGPIP